MKTSKRLTSLMLTLTLFLTSAIISTSAANREIAQTKALMGLLPVGSHSAPAALTASADELPASYNANAQGLVLPVRTQQDNTCWAFGALSTFESLLISKGEEVSTFSPQHANIWATRNSDGTGWQRNEYSGGYSYIPLGYLTSRSGPVSDADFPTTSTKNDYNSFSTSPQYVLNEAVFFNDNAEPDAIKELIYTYGSVVGNFNADTRYLSKRTSFYCSNSKLTINELSGHCVAVVGWDDSYSKENFSGSISGTPENDGAWLIKNSWGEQYNSIGGYFWVSYEDVWMFDSIFGPSYAFTSYEKLTDESRIYQNEIYGATYEFNYLTSEDKNPWDDITYINVFNFEKNNRNLSKVTFETLSLGADYTIYYIPTKNGRPVRDNSLWQELDSGTVDYTGYICVDVPDTLLPEGKGGIGVRISNERTYLENKDKEDYTYIHNSIGVCEWLFSGNKYIFMPSAHRGESFYAKNGNMRDVMDFYIDDLSDDIGGTFVIKAITQNEETPTTVPTSPTETTPEPQYILGDADSSGVVNVKDSTTIQKHIASLVTLSSTQLLASDVNKDNVVNIKDATKIQKFLAGLVDLQSKSAI